MAIETQVASGQPPVDAAELDPALGKLRDLIYRVSGIYHQESKFYLLATRAQRRMTAIGSASFTDYYDRLTTRPNRDAEMRSLLNEITIGETYFFRSRAQLDALSKIILPKLMGLKAKQSFKKLRVWSAGCSTGEEPYTLSILLMEQLTQKFKDWTFEILATDLNDNSIVKCREGMYAEYAIRNLTKDQIQKYFVQEKGLCKVNEIVRTPVKFDRLNLQDQSKMLFMKGFDVIFCCNVLIYFDGVAKRRTVDHFFNGLIPGGYFFLGECETLFGVYDQFRLIHFPGATGYYRPNPGEDAGAPS
ncbi:MAG TPA: CheR family methyltransferase [Candidatus Acidoferrales bacterium]|nr:CheR family methyltransferase [Candidatus Acidoferrales bacterium]